MAKGFRTLQGEIYRLNREEDPAPDSEQEEAHKLEEKEVDSPKDQDKPWQSPKKEVKEP